LGGAFQPTFTGGSGVGYDFAEFIENEANWMAKRLKLGAVGSWANLLRLWEKNNNMWLCGTDPFLWEKNNNMWLCGTDPNGA
jgi:hypothetical protein